MAHFAELELGLYPKEQDVYALDLRFNRTDSDADTRLLGNMVEVAFDFDCLLGLAADPQAYGQQLGQMLFASEDARNGMKQAIDISAAADLKLRIRLYVGAGASELHRLRWETLWGPHNRGPLFLGQRISFSRYLSGTDWRPVTLKTRGDMRALIMIANPNNLEEYNLTPVDVAAEQARARTGIAGMEMNFLKSGGASLEGLREALRQSPDIFYLVCHGSLRRNESWLWLENADGSSERVSGHELVSLFNEMQQVPRLVLLISCESTGSDSGENALAGLGPRLAESGVAAVLCMQGKVSMETMDGFLPAFFQELNREGLLEQAISVARSLVRSRPDWWMPALFTRLKSGKLWYQPGFSDDKLEKWPALVRHIRRQRCTPILGPGLSDHLFGSRNEIARKWAEIYHFPMSAHQFDDIPRVAQYLAINQDPFFPYEELGDEMCRQMRQRFGGRKDAELEELLEDYCENMPADDPFRILTEMELPVYITADPSPTLEIALRQAGRNPRVELCRWNDEMQSLASVFSKYPDYEPSPQSPLVYRLFGEISDCESMVLTEDNYLDFLMGMSDNADLVPSEVRRALADSALIFLGFRLSSWDFRVMFRGIMRCEGRARRRKYAHVGVQMDPEETELTEPERARKYLETYFGEANISIYWGRPNEFLGELGQHLGEGP